MKVGIRWATVMTVRLPISPDSRLNQVISSRVNRSHHLIQNQHPSLLQNCVFRAYYITMARELAWMVGIRKAPILRHLMELVTGVAVVRCFNREDHFLRRCLSLIDTSSRIVFHNSNSVEWLSIWINFLFNLVSSSSWLSWWASLGWLRISISLPCGPPIRSSHSPDWTMHPSLITYTEWMCQTKDMIKCLTRRWRLLCSSKVLLAPWTYKNEVSGIWKFQWMGGLYRWVPVGTLTVLKGSSRN